LAGLAARSYSAKTANYGCGGCQSPPKYLNKAERAQYQAGLAEFLERLKPQDPYKGLVGINQRDRSNLPRLNGSGY